MRIAVCDDSVSFLQQATQVIGRWTGERSDVSISTFEDGDALIQSHSATPFDIILLDTVMPLINGIETAREIREFDKKVKLVFITSSPEFAVESYGVKASNYLLKPLNEQKLFTCLDELTAELQHKDRNIVVKSAVAIHRIDVSRIEYLEAQNKHVLFVLSDGSTIKASDPLYTYEADLPLADGFFKCSRSYIVNINRIDTYTAREVTMRSGSRIPISRNQAKAFESAYFSVIFGKAGDMQ